MDNAQSIQRNSRGRRRANRTRRNNGRRRRGRGRGIRVIARGNRGRQRMEARERQINEIKAIEEGIHRGENAWFSNESMSFASAVTSPFHPEAIGAVRPDVWNPPTIPAQDRLTLDLDPQVLQGLSVAQGLLVTGFVIHFVPRSLATGWISTGPVGPSSNPDVACIAVDTTWGQDSSGIHPLLDPYCIFVGILGTTTTITTPKCLAWSPTDEIFYVGYNVLHCTRIGTIRTGCAGCRLIGAGIKAFSNRAPLTTGGTAFGGWTTLEDVYGAINTNGPVEFEMQMRRRIALKLNRKADKRHRDLKKGEHKEDYVALPGRRKKAATLSDIYERVPINVSEEVEDSIVNDVIFGGPTTIDAENIQDHLQYRKAFLGREGVTVRYSPLQDPLQARFQPTNEIGLLTRARGGELIQAADLGDGIGIGVHDLISNGNYVPSILWKFDPGDGDDANTAGSYTIRLQVVAHTQCSPEGDLPFMTSAVPPDLHFSDLPYILENVDEFPVVVKGQSFKSFYHKLRRKLASAAMRIKAAFGSDMGQLMSRALVGDSATTAANRLVEVLEEDP